MKRLHLYLTETQIAAIRQLAEKTGLPIGDHVRRAIDAYLDQGQRRKDAGKR